METDYQKRSKYMKIDHQKRSIYMETDRQKRPTDSLSFVVKMGNADLRGVVSCSKLYGVLMTKLCLKRSAYMKRDHQKRPSDAL